MAVFIAFFLFFFPAFEFLHSNFSKFLKNIHGGHGRSRGAASMTISEAGEDAGDDPSPADELTDLLLALLKVRH